MSDMDAVRARAAAINQVPIVLRAARAHAGAFEEKAVAEVLRLTGRGELRRLLLDESRTRTGRASLSFPLLEELAPDLPVRFRASRLRFDYEDVFLQLLNDFAATPIWAAWSELATAGEDDGRPMALIFGWPRLKACRGFAVLHDAATTVWLGTRLVRQIGDADFAVETLPSLLHGLGLRAGPDEDAGAVPEEERTG